MTIRISSPSHGNEFDKDDTVWLKASVSSNMPIQVINLKVNKVSNDSLVLFKKIEVAGKSFDLSEYFINTISPHADLVMTVQSVDKDGNETGKQQVNFHCHAH